jgi:hypothetical protein
MNTWLMGAIALVYLFVAINFFRTSEIGFGVSFIGYAVGNIGLILAALKI